MLGCIAINYCFVVDSQTVLVCIAINLLFCCGFTNSVSVYCYKLYCFVAGFTNSVSVYCYKLYCFVVDSQTVLVCIAIILFCCGFMLLFYKCCGFTNSVSVYCYTFIVLLWIHKQC